MLWPNSIERYHNSSTDTCGKSVLMARKFSCGIILSHIPLFLNPAIYRMGSSELWKLQGKIIAIKCHCASLIWGILGKHTIFHDLIQRRSLVVTC